MEFTGAFGGDGDGDGGDDWGLFKRETVVATDNRVTQPTRKKQPQKQSTKRPLSTNNSNNTGKPRQVRGGTGDMPDIDLDERSLDVLSTYDKGHRSRADKDQRMDVIQSRIKRSRDKFNSNNPPYTIEDAANVMLDDSLMTDVVQTTARDYERHVQFKGSTRMGTIGDDDDDDDDDIINDGDLDDEPVFIDDDDEEGDNMQQQTPVPPSPGITDLVAKTMIAPGRRHPETGIRPTINTFQEMVSKNNPRAKLFESNMNSVKGPEQNMFVEVRRDEHIYNHVTDTMGSSVKNQQFTRYAIKKNMKIPDPPIVTKAEIRDALHSPDYEIGERPCVYGAQCTSYKMGKALKAKRPERYANVEPFVCKEFYFGERGEEIAQAIANDIPLSEVHSPQHVMCVLCHLSLVKKYYTEYDLNLAKEPVHVLHAFQVIPNVPGEYPVEKLLMGDDEFKGIIAPFIRFVPDDYVWEPVMPTQFKEEYDPVAKIKRRVPKPAVQHWDERDCLDFR